ncbi:GNAT family N-acetyltransferase [uncultured Paracoccus sp.]|uniref:GNAT family N-acetyltransferase n=1 Tax=Paracoccus sp. S1E-3 TaxID=2756130 RepID=UPI0015EFDB27|nr:GNAT family N-acetyltransferase [uncultured Paracoccus sp.]MBA4490988.1 acetyltransferase [Paracoccus sp. S1E-3]
MNEIAFTPVTEADLPLLRRWLGAPHWQAWWNDDAEVEMGYWCDMLAGRDTTRPFLFHLGGEPMGYIQYWLVRDARVEPWLTETPWVNWLPDDTIGVDISVGPMDALSKGIGSQALAAFVSWLRAEGHNQIIIDPDPANGRAIRAYQKAGFRPITEFEGRTGNCLLMRHHKESETA